MKCVAPTELNCTVQFHCYKGFAPTELQSSLESVLAYYCLSQRFAPMEPQASLTGALPL